MSIHAFKIFAFINLALVFNTTLSAQGTAEGSAQNPDYYEIIKNDGKEYVGIILSDDGREILIETEELGKIYIPKADIRSIVKVENQKLIVNGEYMSAGPFTTRYAFTNNALPIKKGENYNMLNLFGPEVHFAVTNNLNVGIMSTWIGSPAALALKYTFNKSDNKINLSAGTIVCTSGYLNNFKSYGGLHWLSITYGNRMNNITVSGGYGYIQTGKTLFKDGKYDTYKEWPRQSKPMLASGPLFSLAGIAKVGAKASLIFDSMIFIASGTKNELKDEYVFTDTSQMYYTVVSTVSTQVAGVLIMPGMRFQNNERSAFQFCLAGVSLINLKANKNDDFSFPFPMFSWFHRF